MIHYIGFYTLQEFKTKKNVSPASITKMNYIVSKLGAINMGAIKLFSPGYSIEKNSLFVPAADYQIGNCVDVHEAATLGRCNLIYKFLGVLFAHFQLLKYLFFDIKKGDMILLYHSLFYKWDIRLFRKFRSNKVVVEVEELYSAAWGRDNLNKEIRYLNNFDGYIFVNDIMNEKFVFNKPYAVCYGNYEISKNFRFRKDHKNLVYAGVLGQEGSDVDLAIKIMDYLPHNYSLKIAGYGNEDDIRFVKNKILGKRNIEFAGFLSGKEYEDFLSQGDIGLCTRVLANELSDYTFPSKVLVYLTHGLVPLCPSIDCLRKSGVSDLILFYDDPSPESIAKVINQDIRDTSTIQTLETLDNEFLCSLRKTFDLVKKAN